MNKFVYTITTILFLIMAGITVFMVIKKEDVAKPAAIETAVVEPEETNPEPIQETEEVVPTEEEAVPTEEEVVEPAEEEEAKYYTYKVKDAGWLNIRKQEGLDNDPVGVLPRGYTGYVIKMTGHWTLVCANGFIGYCSDTYLELTEIEANDFPEELKGYDENDAGTTIAEGKIGAVEEANKKSVKWR